MTGYWYAKYQTSIEETNPLLDAELSAGSNLIRVRDITGTALTTTELNEDEEEVVVDVPLRYEYYLFANGQQVATHTSSNAKENYVFTGLTANTLYTINIIARNSTTNDYVGAITKQIITVEPYAPDLTGFDENNTYYVIYENGVESARIPITQNAPSNWYDYSSRRWANIVTTANDTESYYVWIPRYEYQILEDRDNLDTSNRRTDVTFITTNITNTNCTDGYKVPEAFWWDNNGDGIEQENEQLKGYWYGKYQLSET